jgi:hypothetical protein
MFSRTVVILYSEAALAFVGGSSVVGPAVRLLNKDGNYSGKPKMDCINCFVISVS